MRDYGKVGPTFWTGKTGKAIKARGSEAVIVSLYLMTSPHSNMLGLYYQPRLYMAHETGLGIEGASKGLQGCIEAEFCAYDEASEMVWVMEMASYQIADELKASDKRCQGVQKEYDALPDNPFLGAFFDHYAQAFHMSARRVFVPPGASPSEGASKPLRSQEQEQEQEQEQKQEQEQEKPTASSATPTIPCPYQRIVDLYHAKLPSLPKVKLMPKGRQAALRKLWGWVLSSSKSDGTRRAVTADQALEWIAGYFARASENDFLMGRTQRGGEHANWRCDIDFLLTDKGMRHVIEKTLEHAA